LGLDALMRFTQGDWARVGSDFVSRLTPPEPEPAASTVVPFPAGPAAPASGRIWPRVLEILAASDPTTAKA